VATRLFDRFRGTHVTLLAFGRLDAVSAGAVRPIHVVDDVQAAGADDLVDIHGDVRETYGVGSSGVVLVRPDGHVGLFGRAGDVGGYLRLTGPP
jgi:hypothetical protein